MLSQPLLMPALRLDPERREQSTADALRWAREPWLAGFCLFGGEPDEVGDLLARLREIAQRPLRMASDMERGVGQQVGGGGAHPDLGLLGLAATPDEVRGIAQGVAFEARQLGVDVLFAPVLDVRSEISNPIVGSRSLGWDPHRVAALGSAFVRGVLDGGALPVAKHYPGHGGTSEDSHDARPVVGADEGSLLRRDLMPFERALGAGCPAVMTAHVAYPALDPSGVIATFSRLILDRLRAVDGGQACVVFTDALLMTGAHEGIGEVEAARLSLEAGCDVLLIPTDPVEIAGGLLDVPASRRAALGDAARAASARWASFEPVVGADVSGVCPSEQVAVRAVALAGVRALAAPSSRVFLVDDDGLPGRGDVAMDLLRSRGHEAVVLRPNAGELIDVAPGAGDAVVVMASIRAWKGAAGVSPATQELLTRWGLLGGAATGIEVVWATPLPLGPGAHLPGTGAHLERALAACWTVTNR